METQIKAEIVAHSINEQGDELISVLATFPRIILAEVNTHRMLSKNTSSSRAIPFKKMVETVKADPFIPIAWQRGHSGMQGSEYLTGSIDIAFAHDLWLEARDRAVKSAKAISKEGTDGVPFVTKQLANRLLEPFMWTTMLITGSREGWDNFFKLRCPQYATADNEAGKNSKYHKSWKDVVEYLEGRDKIDDSVIEAIKNKSLIEKLEVNKGQAEIHIMDLAEKIYDAVNESTPKILAFNEWHIPFSDKINGFEFIEDPWKEIKVSVAMAARTSYTIVGEEKEIDYEAMIGLHDRLLAQDPPHSSPLEHCAKAMTNEEYSFYVKGKGEWWKHPLDSSLDLFVTNKNIQGWCNNFKGFIPYRYMVDNGKVD